MLTLQDKALLKLVEQETDKLKQYATQEELDRLEFSELHSSDPLNCIYGQMTGTCWSRRASDLIVKCAEKLYIGKKNTELYDNVLNGEPTLDKLEGRGKHQGQTYFSPIESFICIPSNKVNGNNEMLINYLKGNVDKLEFKTD